MRRKDKKLLIERLNKRLNEDFNDDMATHREKFSEPYDDSNFEDNQPEITSDEVMEFIMKSPLLWAMEKQEGFKNSSSQRAFYFDWTNPEELYFEVETLEGEMLVGWIDIIDDERIRFKTFNKESVGVMKVTGDPQMTAKAFMRVISSNKDRFRDMDEGYSGLDAEMKNMDEHHSGEYSETIMNMTVGELLDVLKAKDATGYEVVEKVIEENFNETQEEGVVGLPADMEIVDEDCGCSVNEAEPTDVKNSQWFSDVDAERITDKQVD